MTNSTAPLKILKASAGSGKTFSLTLHYLNLLLNREYRYKEILAVTFTNKATAEMKDRIMSVLLGLAKGDESSKTESFRKLLLAKNTKWTAPILQNKAYSAYRNIIHDYNNFTISTIDGFSQKVIRSFTYELHIDSGYNVEMNIDKVKSELSIMLNDILDERPDLLKWIIEYADDRIANNKNWNYRRTLQELTGMIFSENFQELHQNLSQHDIDELFEQINTKVSTYCKDFIKLLEETIKTCQTGINEFIIDEAKMKGKSRNKILKVKRTSYKLSNQSASDIHKIFEDFIFIAEKDDAFTDQDKNIRYDLKEGLAPYLEKILEIHKSFPVYIAFDAVKQKLYFLRLIMEMSKLLTQWRKDNYSILISDSQILLNRLGVDVNDDPTFLWEKIGNRYNYFLFDEFQDTSRIQWNNFRPLLLNALSTASQKENEHLIVGDVKQSIYRWRNGDWRILLQQVEEQIAQAFHLDEKKIPAFIQNETLSHNYRSLPHIIRFNNYLYEKLPSLIQNSLNKKIENEANEEALAWWNGQQYNTMIRRAYANSHQEIPELKNKDSLPQGTIEIKYIPVKSYKYRGSQVAEEALNMLCGQIGEWLTSGKYRAEQIGILVRSNKQALAVIENLMAYKKENNLSFQVISGEALSLASNNAVQLLIETLYALVYESKEHAVYLARASYLYNRIQNGKPFCSEVWLTYKDNNPEDLKSILPESLINNWETYKKLPLVFLLENLIHDYDLTSGKEAHIPYILAFKDLIHDFTKSGERGIVQFLDYWQEDGVKANLPSDIKINAIEVSTVHKSKGLAYDVVMLPFCDWEMDRTQGSNNDFWLDVEEGVFSEFGKLFLPYTKMMGQSIFYKQYYEEKLFKYMDVLNTLYVATTRAIQHLYILAPGVKEKAKTTPETPELEKWEVRDDLISDFIFQIALEKDSPYPIRNAEIKINAEEIISPTKKAQEDKNTIHIHEYPVSSFFTSHWEAHSTRTINQILSMERASLYGNLAHEILSEINNKDEVVSILHRYLEEGVIQSDEKENILREVEQIWKNPKINNWMSGSYQVKSEASIINSDGKTLRPDKVFISGEETVVLDFKFTSQKKKSHTEQVKTYLHVLKGMSSNPVKGYLFYAHSNELIEVL